MSAVSSEILEKARALQSQSIQALKSRFIEKDDILDLMAVCLVARENLFLLGPPGTAKTALVHHLARSLHARAFDYLLTRFTEPNELFGPFDIRKLREGELVTNTEGMLPEAEFVFLDELLNANSAILNSLLLALNERIFRRGRETRKLPALLFIGASNHLPEDDALRALFDRFPLRAHCVSVTESRLPALLAAGWAMESSAAQEASLTADDLRALQGAVQHVDLSPARDAYVSLVLKLRQAGISISDRRAVRLQRSVAASALLAGRASALPSDLWILRHVWDRDEQIEVLASLVNETLRQQEPAENDHPRARNEDAPDPEALRAAIDQLAPRLGADQAEPLRATALDDLRVLASRIEWVRNETTRAALRAKADALWPADKAR